MVVRTRVGLLAESVHEGVIEPADVLVVAFLGRVSREKIFRSVAPVRPVRLNLEQNSSLITEVAKEIN